MNNNLTWEDIRRIVVISEDVFEEGNNLSEQQFYEEILRRFNDKQSTLTPNDMTEKEIFKKKLYDLLFEATRTEELSVERLFEIVDAIADDVLYASKQTGL